MSDLKPGQKYPTPTKGFGDRVFYETLLRQNPASTMAQEWCVNYGVLSREEAKKIYEQVVTRKRGGKASSSPVSVKSEKKRVKVVKDED